MPRLRISPKLARSAVVPAFLALSWLAWPHPPHQNDAPAAALLPPGVPAGRTMRGMVDSAGVDEWTLRFMAGRRATILLYGEDASRLHCILRDAAGNPVDSARGSPAGCRL